MAELKGTNVGAPIVPFTDQDIYATHEARYGKGGFRSVQTLEELRGIPEARLEEGMLVYVIDDPTGIHTYQRIGGSWIRDRIGKGIPIYNQELIEEFGINPSTETYISIPDEDTDLSGTVRGNTYKTSINGNYMDILFSAIRELQSEVARLKNSFRYGIESYTGTRTAMSETVGEIEVPEEEPLWAVEEDGLSEVYELKMTEGKGGGIEGLVGGKVSSVTDPVTFRAFLNIEGTSQWLAPEKEVLSVEDPKMFLYLTTKGNGEKKLDIQIDLTEDGKTVSETIDLSTLDLSPESISGYYNTLVILGREQILNSKPQGNDNFIWISISNPETNSALIEGYLVGGNIVNLGDQGVTGVAVPERYQFKSIHFTDTTVNKFKIYSKYQDFSKNIIGSIPSDESYKFKVAHLTIRSVESTSILTEMKDQILNNELIWDEGSGRLWIKTNNKLAVIGGGSSGTGGSSNTDSDNMTQEELINALKEMGIVYESGGGLNINNLSVDGITFVHTASGKKFKFYVNSQGELCNDEIPDESMLLNNRATKVQYTPTKNVRGYIGCLGAKESGLKWNADLGLGADRLKIGAFYAPFSTDLAHGCTHSFIELENTSNKDIALSGCYLHLTRPNEDGNQVTYSLPLTGIIKAGGTYLVRGAKHTEPEDPNAYIKVNTCDQEWWHQGKLVSLEVDESLSYTSNELGYGICLTYGNDFDGKPLTHTTRLIEESSTSTDRTLGTVNDPVDISGASAPATYPYIVYPNFIDAIYYKSIIKSSGGSGYWAINPVAITENSMYRNTFELDPAKQAFQGLTTKDSSRVRWSNNTNDAQVVDLSKEYIVFPHTDDIYAISNYTPKASWEGKNVSTDKSKLDTLKPNMVTCSFGIDMYKTRTFNWISVGYYDEYIWIRRDIDNSPWIGRFSSYIPKVQIKIKNSQINTTSEGSSSTDITFTVMNTGWRGGLGKYTKLVTPAGTAISGVNSVSSGMDYKATIPGSLTLSANDVCYLLQAGDEVGGGSEYPRKKVFNADINNNVYSRMTGKFPGDNSYYTAHKVILDIVDEPVSAKTTYKYVVGRADKNGNPDPKHVSEEMSFTLYPTSYAPRVYQTSDQQGFTWIEYQVWAAAAKELNKKILGDLSKDNVMPVLINTGDMTQNGTRINEWFDYYQAGRDLFRHLEQVNVVGNNDLCGTNPWELGTGDDVGKSNSFYFHLFYCYEVGDLFTPLISYAGGSTPKYIPSLYYMDSVNNRFLMVNSEITETNCRDWYGLVGNYPINIYTGFEINGASATPEFHSDFTSIYTMIYRTLKNAQDSGKSVLVGCHEMPFTVITNDSLGNNYAKYSRSLSNSGALVGSHLNQISTNEKTVGERTSKKGIYWFSRLLEYFGVKLCIGGHKHTYTSSYPVRENYKYTLNGESKNSKDHGRMPMSDTLEGDTVDFIDISTQGGNEVIRDLSKFPLVKRTDPGTNIDGTFYPGVAVPDLEGGVVYFMCQSTGYKLTSNKELPSANQIFTELLPQTKVTGGKDVADNNQKYPMFAIIDLKSGGGYTVKLVRIENVLNDTYKFTQTQFGKKTPILKYLKKVDGNNYGAWVTSENDIINI